MTVINNAIACLLTKWLGTRAQGGEELEQKVRYAIVSTLDEVEKFVILCVVFCLVGYAREFIVVMAIIGSIRKYLGGCHMKTTTGCIVLSFTIIFIAITIAQNIDVTMTLENIVYIVLLMLIFYEAPIPSLKGIRYKHTSKLIFKIKALITLMLISRLAFLVPGWCRRTIVVALMVQCVETIVASVIVKCRKEGIDYERKD